MNYWLMKSEPSVFSISDLKKQKKTGWEGVRNYQARNFMRDQMKKEDMILFYHSNCEEPGIVGLARVVEESHPDPTQWDKKSDYYDSKATLKEPRWFMVRIEFVEIFPQVVSLQKLKSTKGLEALPVVQKGSRLSINPVSENEFKTILKLKSL